MNFTKFTKLIFTLIPLYLLIAISSQISIETKRCSLNIKCDQATLVCFLSSDYSSSLSSSAEQILRDECPSLFKSTRNQDQNDITVCCSSFGVHRLKFFLNYYKSAFTCTACWLNFKELFCQLICSPNQEDFVKVLKKKGSWALSLDKELYVWIEYYVTKSFALKTYESCKNMPSSPYPQISPTCSPQSPECDLHKWLSSIHYRIPSLFDYRINLTFNLNLSAPFHFQGDYINPMNEQVYSCDEKSQQKMTTCSVNDCKKVCHRVKPTTLTNMVICPNKTCKPCEERRISSHPVENIHAQSSNNRIISGEDIMDQGKNAYYYNDCRKKCGQLQNPTFKYNFPSEEQYFSYLGEFIVSACAFSVICSVMIALFCSVTI